MTPRQFVAWIVAASLALLLLLIIYGILAGSEHLNVAATVLAVPIAMASALLAWYALRQGENSAVLDKKQMTAVRTELEIALRTYWKEEQEALRLQNPFPMPTRWRNACELLSDSWENIQEGATSNAMNLAGGIQTVLETYESVPSGRLVILGKAGAGKTALSIQLSLALLEKANSSDDHLPLPISVHNWIAGETGISFRYFLERELISRYPYMGGSLRSGNSLASSILAEGCILPVIDGLEQLPLQDAANAIADIGSSSFRFILTCRSRNYASIVRERSRPLARAAVVKMEDLDVDDALAYLRSVDPIVIGQDSSLEKFAKLSEIRQILGRPLMVYLARIAYGNGSSEPSEWLDTVRDPTADAIAEHLFGRYLPAIYDAPREKARSGLVEVWTSQDVRPWFQFIASHANNERGAAINWWSLSREVPPWVPLLSGPLLGIVVGLLAAPLFAARNDSVAFGLAYGVGGGLIFGIEYAVAFLLLRGRPPTRTSFAWRRNRPTRGLDRKGALFGATYGLALGLTLGVMATIPAMILGLPRPFVHLVTGVVFGIFAAMLGAFVFGIRRPVDLTRARDPQYLYRLDRTVAIVLALGGGLILALGLTAWGHLTLTRITLAFSHKTPVRIMTFLDDARRRGVLRLSGSGYVFRHEQLRTYVSRPTASPPTPS